MTPSRVKVDSLQKPRGFCSDSPIHAVCFIILQIFHLQWSVLVFTNPIEMGIVALPDHFGGRSFLSIQMVPSASGNRNALSCGDWVSR